MGNAKVNSIDSKAAQGKNVSKGSSLRKTNLKADLTPSKTDLRGSQGGSRKNEGVRGSSLRDSTRSIGKGVEISPSKVKLNV